MNRKKHQFNNDFHSYLLDIFSARLSRVAESGKTSKKASYLKYLIIPIILYAEKFIAFSTFDFLVEIYWEKEKKNREKNILLFKMIRWSEGK